MSADLASARLSIRERAKFVLFHRVGYLFFYQSDYIILLLSSSLAMLGYYAQYQYIYAGLLSFSLTVGGTLTAKVARRQLTLGKPAFPRLYRLTSMYTAVGATVGALALLFLIRPAIAILYRGSTIVEPIVMLFAGLLWLNITKINDDIWIDTTGAYSTGY